MATPVNVVLQPYRIGEKQGHSIRPVINATMTYEDTLQEIARTSGVNAAKVRAVMDALTLVIIDEAIQKQMNVKLGFGDIRLTVTGGLSDLSESINDKCRAGVNFQPCAEIARLLKQVELVNKTKSVALYIDVVVEQGHPTDRNMLFTPNATVSITTNCGRIDTTRDDEGIWLVDAAGGKVATGVVTTTNAEYTLVQFPTLPEPGQYTLVYACRNGEDAGEFTPAVKRRKVTVVEAE